MSNLITFEESEELKLVEPSKAKKIKALFEPMTKMLEGFEQAYNEVILEAEQGIDEALMSKAKRLRLDIGKIRIEADKARKAEKEEYLRAGKAIDGANNILKWAVVDRENKLKEIEEHFEILEKEAKAKLQAQRVELLSKYVDDAEERDLSLMDNDVWNAYLGAKKRAYEDRIKAEKEAELARIEAEKKEREENERIRKENEALKKQREEEARKAKELALAPEKERLTKWVNSFELPELSEVKTKYLNQ